jgi:hypothetical protein
MNERESASVDRSITCALAVGIVCMVLVIAAVILFAVNT